MNKVKRIKTTVKSAVENGLKAGDKILIECEVVKINEGSVDVKSSAMVRLTSLLNNDIIRYDKPGIDFSRAGRVLTCKEDGMVVMTTGRADNLYFSGYILEVIGDDFEKGETFNDFSNGPDWIDITDTYGK